MFGISLKFLPHALHLEGLFWEFVGEIGTFIALILSLHFAYEIFIKDEDRKVMRNEIDELITQAHQEIKTEISDLKQLIEKTHKLTDNEGIIVLPADKIAGKVKSSLDNTDIWFYFGAIGRYIRTDVLPKLCDEATRKNEHKKVKLLLIDPCCQSLVDQYSRWRKNIPDASGLAILKEGNIIKNEIYATVLSACHYMQLQPLLKIEISFRSYFSYHRLDITSDMVLISRDHAKENAIAFSKKNFLYSVYKEDFNALFNNNKKLEIAKIDLNDEVLVVANARALLEALDICEHLADEEIEQIISIVNNSKNPYA